MKCETDGQVTLLLSWDKIEKEQRDLHPSITPWLQLFFYTNSITQLSITYLKLSKDSPTF